MGLEHVVHWWEIILQQFYKVGIKLVLAFLQI